MKILLIGGTGTISSAITRQLAVSGHDLWLLNRGTRKNEVPASVKQVICDINDTEDVLHMLSENTFDAVCEFIGFTPAQVERVPTFPSGTRHPSFQGSYTTVCLYQLSLSLQQACGQSHYH